ncbi:MAG TPA: indolepyruvate oxidoreductase subunit beta [Thermodesulfobacteriota bacterium]|nr:indolepyruvate oxidoreductase subunit beta [Thermodesulfobacteriota bacterium]HOC39695.1 indolepyruvate oxidoreductase subunit beta [Thermodesulfobacteriota bacterium]
MTCRRIVIKAVGGQGNLLISKILGEAAIKAGISVQMNEVHGMAQRGGVVETDVLLGDILSSTISDGEADVLLALEPLEAARAVGKCNKDTLIISSTTSIVPSTVATGGAAYPDSEALLNSIKLNVKELITIDAGTLAKQAGSGMAANMVMLGALVRKGDLPFSADIVKQTIQERVKESFREINLRAFDLGYNAAAGIG